LKATEKELVEEKALALGK